MHDEEYIAEGFASLGHEVIRVDNLATSGEIKDVLQRYTPDILLFCKWEQPPELDAIINAQKKTGLKTVCWIFDLYIGYQREYQVKTRRFFKADYVFTTDGGHQEEFAKLGVNHHCVRQGIRASECVLEKGNPIGVAFVGSDNPLYPYRQKMLGEIMLHFPNFKWYGRGDSDEVRGMQLNKIFANTKVIIGDAVYSPYYWSNRVVETLGRGGFLIHPDVPGIKKEYPHIVTYEVGNIQDLKNKITYYLNHEQERKDIIKLNFDWVKDNYTVEKKCKELLNVLQSTHNN